jgi:ABC-type nickel/cobalt efflux system permease component RcnA
MTTYVNANPFLGNSDNATPEVRPPSASGFLVETQLRFREILGNSLTALQKGANPELFFTIMGFSFLYGLLHAAGPGHRKTVIFSLFLSRKAKWNEPLIASFVAAGVHGGTAVLLILLFQLFYSSVQSILVKDISAYMEGISYGLLALLALWFFIISGNHHHHHGKHKKETNIYAALALSSLFPCPGVIMIMTFSAALGIIKTGILAVIVLSIGMGVTISIVAYLAFFGRESLFHFMKDREKQIGKLTGILERGSYLFLFLFSLWMAWPFLRALIT